MHESEQVEMARTRRLRLKLLSRKDLQKGRAKGLRGKRRPATLLDLPSEAAHRSQGSMEIARPGRTKK